MQGGAFIPTWFHRIPLCLYALIGTRNIPKSLGPLAFPCRRWNASYVVRDSVDVTALLRIGLW